MIVFTKLKTCAIITFGLYLSVCTSGFAHEIISKSAIEHFIPVPLAKQATDYTCGASTTQSIMAYYGDDSLESDLAKDLGTNPIYGTDHRPMISFFRSKGYQVNAYEGMTVAQLQGHLSKGDPVVCLIQAWEDNVADYTDFWGSGHYVIAIGYDQERIYFMDPWTLGNYTYIPVNEFIKRWHHVAFDYTRLFQWGMVVNKDTIAYQPDAVLYLP